DHPDDRRRDADPARLDADADPRLELARPGPEQPALPRPADAGRGEDLAWPGAADAAGAAEADLPVTRLVLVAAAALVLFVPAAGSRPAETPGVTGTQVLIGGTVPLSGQASAFGAIGPAANAYFKYVNARGGVHGRKLKYLYRDDGYDPSRTLELTRELVEQDKVFAIFNTIGTEHTIAIRGYLNAVKVPEVFAGTGAAKVGRGYKQFPWTMGYLPSFEGEGAIYGRYVVTHRPKAKIAVLYENSDYGNDLLHGLQRGLGNRSSRCAIRRTLLAVRHGRRLLMLQERRLDVRVILEFRRASPSTST